MISPGDGACEMDHVNEACEVRHMSVVGLPRCVALMVVLAWMLWPYAPRGSALLPVSSRCREQGERPVPVMPSVMAV